MTNIRAVKYFGVTLDSKLTFIRHIRAVSASAASAGAISHLMPNIDGPSAVKRLLAAIISSSLLFAAPVWASRATRFKGNRTILDRAQRLVALWATWSYRTVFTAAALFLVEMPPPT